MVTQAIGTDWRLWGVAVLSAASLIWNVINGVKANAARDEARQNRTEIQKLDAAHKQRIIRLEEFRSSVRDPIKATFPGIRSLVIQLKAMARTSTSLSEMEGELKALNLEVTQVIGALGDALAEANESEFAQGDDWADEIWNTQDRVAEALNLVLDETKPQIERLTELSNLANVLAELRSAVSAKLEAALKKFADESAVFPDGTA